MKIIFGQSNDAVAEHARKVVGEEQEKNKAPRGIAVHSAHSASYCDDCGETYWHKYDPYGWFTHIGCKGEKGKASAGF